MLNNVNYINLTSRLPGFCTSLIDGGFAESLFATRLALTSYSTSRRDRGINWYFKVQDALRGTRVSDRGINELIWLLPSTFQMKERLINIDIVVPKRPINGRMTSVLHPSVPSPCCCSSTLSLMNTASWFSAILHFIYLWLTCRWELQLYNMDQNLCFSRWEEFGIFWWVKIFSLCFHSEK